MRYFRVFGLNENEPDGAQLLTWARDHESTAQVSLRGDDRGWFEAELAFPELEQYWHISRFLADEEGIRRELNTWAAWLETHENNPHHAFLMSHMIATRQVFTIEQPEDDHDGIGADRLAELCRRLAQITGGVYQIDGQGFIGSDGKVLIEEHGE
jgi:hypothetical protein